MGTTYYGLCHDCFRYIDLDKFYSFAAYDEGSHADFDKENLEEFGESFVYRALRLQYFLRKHTDHRVGVHTEHDVEQFDGWYDKYETDGRTIKWHEEFPWPKRGKHANETIDLRDPKAGRVVLLTKHGDIYIDIRNDGVNCFRFINNEREDTLLLPRKR